MKKPLLKRPDVEKEISRMWEQLDHLTDEDGNRQDLVDEAMRKERDLLKQLDVQEKSLDLLWNAANVITPENPLSAALAISANAERLTSILKSYNQSTAQA